MKKIPVLPPAQKQVPIASSLYLQSFDPLFKPWYEIISNELPEYTTKKVKETDWFLKY